MMPPKVIERVTNRAAGSLAIIALAFLLYMGSLILLGIRSGTNWMALASPYTMALAIGFVAAQGLMLFVVSRDRKNWKR